MVENPCAEIDDGHQRRAIDRCAAADERRVDDQQRDRSEHRQPAQDAGEPKGADNQPGQDRDVAARNRDHVIRARFLQLALNVKLERPAIADHDRGHDSRRALAPSSDAIVDGPA